MLQRLAPFQGAVFVSSRFPVVFAPLRFSRRLPHLVRRSTTGYLPVRPPAYRNPPSASGPAGVLANSEAARKPRPNLQQRCERVTRDSVSSAFIGVGPHVRKPLGAKGHAGGRGERIAGPGSPRKPRVPERRRCHSR